MRSTHNLLAPARTRRPPTVLPSKADTVKVSFILFSDHQGATPPKRITQCTVLHPFHRPAPRNFIKKNDPKEEALAKLKNMSPAQQQKVSLAFLFYLWVSPPGIIRYATSSHLPPLNARRNSGCLRQSSASLLLPPPRDPASSPATWSRNSAPWGTCSARSAPSNLRPPPRLLPRPRRPSFRASLTHRPWRPRLSVSVAPCVYNPM